MTADDGRQIWMSWMESQGGANVTDYKILIKEMPEDGDGPGLTVWASEIRGAATLEDAVARFVQVFDRFTQEDFGESGAPFAGGLVNGHALR